jgi:hypothetical protein
MDLTLTSFDISQLHRRERHNTGIFDGMPPAPLAITGQEFTADYAAPLICQPRRHRWPDPDFIETISHSN